MASARSSLKPRRSYSGWKVLSRVGSRPARIATVDGRLAQTCSVGVGVRISPQKQGPWRRKEQEAVAEWLVLQVVLTGSSVMVNLRMRMEDFDV